MKASYLPKKLDGIGSRKYFVDFQVGTSNTEMHWHDCIEIIYVERGNARIFFNDKWYQMGCGDMIFIPPHILHYIRCDDKNTLKTVIGVTKELICDTSAREEFVILPFETNTIADYCFFKGNENFMKFFDELKQMNETYYNSLLVQAEILRLYANIYKYWQTNGLVFLEPTTDKTIYKITSFLEKNYSTAPTAEQMAKQLNMSYSNMSRILSTKLGTNYTSLLNSIRIKNAKKLLSVTDKNITEICFECGYENSSYFIKIFKQQTGMTPKKYRMLIS